MQEPSVPHLHRGIPCLVLAVILATIPGCLSFGSDDFAVNVPSSYTGDPRGTMDPQALTGTWYVDAVIEGWTFFVQPLDGSEATGQFRAQMTLIDPDSDGAAMVIGDPATGRSQDGGPVVALSGFASGALDARVVKSVDGVTSSAEGREWLLFSAFASEPAHLTARFEFTEGLDHQWLPAPLNMGNVKESSTWLSPSRAEASTSLNLDAEGAAIVWLQGVPQKGSERHLEISAGQPYYSGSTGTHSEGTAAVPDAMAILAGPAGRYEAIARESHAPDATRLVLVHGQAHNLGSWFRGEFGPKLYWSLASTINDQDFFGPPER